MRIEAGKIDRSYKVLLDGEDVSQWCYMADDETGEVGLYRREWWRDTDEPEQEIRRGKVVII